MPELNHHSACTGGTVHRYTNRAGYEMAVCRGCGFYTVLAGEVLGPASRTVTAASVDETSRYRCREHPDQPVTWRGRGCPACSR